jgi:hypothetical protein
MIIVSRVKTIGLITYCASLKSATHVVFDAQTHCSRQCLCNAWFLKLACNTCLLREIHIMTLATYEADVKLAQLAIDPIVFDIDTNKTLHPVDQKLWYLRF